MPTNFRNKPASQHSFAMIPRADIPRSKYLLQQNRKQAFNAAYLVPILCEEMVPGDHFSGNTTIYARFATPITPVLDNAELETFFFFVPNRILWDNWEEFMAGENFLLPTTELGAGTIGDIWDHFGIPRGPQITDLFNIQVLPARAYNRIFNEWFRDQNLTTELANNTDNGPDSNGDYALVKRAKKHDYFTSCLPWPQKGNTAVSLPLGTTAPVIANPDTSKLPLFTQAATAWPGPATQSGLGTLNASANVQWAAGAAGATGTTIRFGTETGLLTDLSLATAATINDIRTAFQTQRFLERQARGGSRYTELIQSQFGVRPPDFRLQRPEYLGGGKTMVNTHPIAQTSETGAETPLGNLAAFTTAHGQHHSFNYAATEHGYIIGLAQVRTDLTYQQGLRRHWSRSTYLDFYTPVFAHLGEQAVLSKEIFLDGTANDELVFGYQERWAEYRYTPNEITGMFRSIAPTSIDIWHYSEEFATRPTLNDAFITDPSMETIARSLAVGEEAAGQQILMDVLHRIQATRPMPTYSVPGLIDHF